MARVEHERSFLTGRGIPPEKVWKEYRSGGRVDADLYLKVARMISDGDFIPPGVNNPQPKPTPPLPEAEDKMPEKDIVTPKVHLSPELHPSSEVLHLTQGEHMILQKMALGELKIQITAEFGLDVKTWRNLQLNIQRKVGEATKTAPYYRTHSMAIRLAIQEGSVIMEHPPLDELNITPTEFGILKLLSEGKGLPTIKQTFSLSNPNLKEHVEKLYEKLGANNKRHLESIALSLFSAPKKPTSS